MKLPCEIVQDLLPLYADGVCSEQSKTEIQTHVAECEGCRRQLEAMRSQEQALKETKEMKDMKFAQGLNGLKRRVNRKLRIVIAESVVAAVALVLLIEVLFNLPLKPVGAKDIQLSAQSYAVGTLEKLQADTDGEASVTISKGENDLDGVFVLEIPELSNAEIALTESAAEDVDYITAIQWNCKYHLKKVEDHVDEDGTLYIESANTTLLNNRAEESAQKFTMLEMQKIRRIVYLEKDGGETVLWEE